MSSVITITEAERATLVRMLGKAHTEGVRIYQNPHDGRYYASSTSNRSQLHYVTAYSCDCPGFMHHGHCKHHAALLETLGWITLPTPDPLPCRHCAGRGFWIQAIHGERVDVPCPHCQLVA
jgi:hypothetical protein